MIEVIKFHKINPKKQNLVVQDCRSAVTRFINNQSPIYKFKLKDALKKNPIDRFINKNHSEVIEHKNLIEDFEVKHQQNIEKYLEKKVINDAFSERFDKYKERKHDHEKRMKEGQSSNDIIFKDLFKRYREKGYKLSPITEKKNIFQASSLLMEDSKIVDYLHFSTRKDIYNGELNYLSKVKEMSIKQETNFKEIKRGQKFDPDEIPNYKGSSEIDKILILNQIHSNKDEIAKLKQMVTNNAISSSDTIDNIKLQFCNNDDSKLRYRKLNNNNSNNFRRASRAINNWETDKENTNFLHKIEEDSKRYGTKKHHPVSIFEFNSSNQTTLLNPETGNEENRWGSSMKSFKLSQSNSMINSLPLNSKKEPTFKVRIREKDSHNKSLQSVKMTNEQNVSSSSSDSKQNDSITFMKNISTYKLASQSSSQNNQKLFIPKKPVWKPSSLNSTSLIPSQKFDCTKIQSIRDQSPFKSKYQLSSQLVSRSQHNKYHYINRTLINRGTDKVAMISSKILQMVNAKTKDEEKKVKIEAIYENIKNRKFDNILKDVEDYIKLYLTEENPGFSLEK